MPPTSRIIIILLIVILLAAGAVAFLWNRGASSPRAFKFETLKLFSWGDRGGSEGDAAIAGNLTESYLNSDFGFSFQRPEGFKVTSMTDELGETILVQKEGSAKNGFQVFISPLDEPGPITVERIKMDLPDMAMESPQEAVIGGAPALVFFSQDESFGRTREVWFIWPPEPVPHGNYLYQITSPAEFDEELSKIMATFKFE